jgi:hypothetical protein
VHRCKRKEKKGPLFGFYFIHIYVCERLCEHFRGLFRKVGSSVSPRWMVTHAHAHNTLSTLLLFLPKPPKMCLNYFCPRQAGVAGFSVLLCFALFFLNSFFMVLWLLLQFLAVSFAHPFFVAVPLFSVDVRKARCVSHSFSHCLEQPALKSQLPTTFYLSSSLLPSCVVLSTFI